jgi:protein phosphatase
LIQPEEVNGHPNAHVIRRYLGSPAPPEVDFRMRIQNGEGESIQPSPNAQGFALQPGDCLLLCSDGLTDLVSDEEILAAFKLSAMETAGHRLIDMANQRGGHDNITLVAIQVPVPKVKTALPFTARRAAASSRRVALGCLGVIALAIVAGALAGRSILNPGSQATPTIIQGTPSVTPTRTPLRTSTVNAQILPLVPTVTNTPALALPPASNAGPTITPWPTNTPGLPIVTRSP